MRQGDGTHGLRPRGQAPPRHAPGDHEDADGAWDPFPAQLAIVSYGEAEERNGSLGQLAIQRQGGMPLAALIGPPAVRDLRIDMEEILPTPPSA